jgi:hypothetical protein
MTLYRTVADNFAQGGSVRLMVDTAALIGGYVTLPPGSETNTIRFIFDDTGDYVSGARGFVYPARASFRGFTLSCLTADGCARDRIPPFTFYLDLVPQEARKGRLPGGRFGFGGSDFSGNAHLASLRCRTREVAVYVPPETPFSVLLTTVGPAPFPAATYAIMLDMEVLCGIPDAQPRLTDALPLQQAPSP